VTESFFCGYTIGTDALAQFAAVCRPLGKRVLIIGGKTALSVAEKKIRTAISDGFEVIDSVFYGGECTKENATEIFERYKNKGIDFVVGVGGGKALDTAKCTAFLLKKRVVTIPTISSTCAAASALSVVYTSEHSFSEFWYYEKPAFHCFIDTEIIANAPEQFLRAGIGDTLAKYYEVEFSSRNAKKNYSDEMAIAISKLCGEPLFEDAKTALESCKNSEISEELEKVIRIIIVSTGMVSMLINPKFNGAMAHALFYGLTEIEGFEERVLHGDAVGYTSAIQLVLDNKEEEAKKLIKFLNNINITTGLKKMGVSLEREALNKALKATLKDPDMEVIPYEITEDMLYDAIIKTECLEEIQ